MHSRDRHHHSRRQHFRPEYGFALLVSLLALAATIPRGSVGFFESRLIAIGAWLIGGLGWLTAPAVRPAQWPLPRRLAGAAALLLALWCGWQLWSGSGERCGQFWRGDAKLFADVMADASAGSLAVERFISFHTAWLWAGLGVLAWAGARRFGNRKALKAVVVGLLAVGIVQAILGISLGVDAGGRLQGTFGSPNALGGLLAMTLPVQLGFMLSRAARRPLRGRTGWRWWLQRLGDSWEAWLRPLLWFTWLLQWAALYLTGSMGGATAALAACAILAIWLAKERPDFRARLAGWGGALVLAALVFGLHARQRNVLDRAMGETGALETSKASRLEIWRMAWAFCRDFPLGAGPGGTSRVLAMNQPESMGRFRSDYAHNDVLQFAGDLGWPGGALLALLLGLTLWHGLQACRQAGRDDGGAVWLRRGAWGAVLGALVHAQTEFNLSARPGVQLLFMLLCGILWSRTDWFAEPDGPGAASEGTVARRRHRAIMVVAMVAAIWFSGRSAWAWRLHEGACAAAGLSGDPYYVFSKPAVASEDAERILAQAQRAAPQAALLRLTAAKYVLGRHDRMVDQVARDLLRAENIEVSDESWLDPADAVHEQARRGAAVATRAEEKTALETALADARRAVALAPWDSAARLLRAEVYLRMAAMPGLFPAASDLGLRDLNLVAALYPANAYVLAEACAVLARGPGMSGDRERLLDWGTRALRMDSSRAWTVFDAWWRRRIGVQRILESAELPVEILWNMYVRLDRAQRQPEARQCLMALEQRVWDEQLPPAASWWAPLRRKQWNIQQGQYRIRIATEWLKRHLREGEWEQIAASASTRAAMRSLRFQIEMDKMELAGSASPALRRLRLREWAATGRLAPDWTCEWILAESEVGSPLRSTEEFLAELILLNEESRLRERLAVLRLAGGEFAMANALLEALRAELAQQPEQAEAILSGAMAQGRIYPRYAHRVWLWRARLQTAAGLISEAEAAQSEAAAACPTDPDAAGGIASAVPFPAIALPRLDLGFAGQRLRLLRAAIQKPGDDSGTPALLLVWRFCGSLPPDLRFDMRIRDADGHARLRRGVVVDQEIVAKFNHGMPALGSTWTWTVPLTAFAAKGCLLDVWATAGKTRLPADDGLALLEINLEKLPRFSPPDRP
ncbi:MAG: O-antigen ligase domain-containing protein [Spartobacteria bacterium]|nr:O-antigen ligase domain-containing protein [Spartobacteria bacterium]